MNLNNCTIMDLLLYLNEEVMFYLPVFEWRFGLHVVIIIFRFFVFLFTGQMIVTGYSFDDTRLNTVVFWTHLLETSFCSYISHRTPFWHSCTDNVYTNILQTAIEIILWMRFRFVFLLISGLFNGFFSWFYWGGWDR